MDRKLFERQIMTGLVILLAVEITLLTLHLVWGGFRPKHLRSETELAGEVSSQQRELRRRSLNSLVWEKSSAHDSIYYYDSILTLSQSTASLKLFKDTDLRLSENTLVTIEPPSDSKHGEIRLQFHKGGFKARNPYAKTEITSDNWSMEIKTGSEVDLRQAGDDDFELQVTKGEVEFKSADGKNVVGKDQLLRIDGTSAKPLQLLPDETLHWVNPPQKRVYTHKKSSTVVLEWEGVQPTQLVKQTLGIREEILPIEDDIRRMDLELPIGHHVLYLRSGDQTSSALEVEVWAAPVVHLVSPLPRNRVKTGESVEFVWMLRPEVALYHFSLIGATKHEQVLRENSLIEHFEAEDDAEWRVDAEDKDGFSIPAPYRYPLFIREAPLAAPHLKSPVIRAPAKEKQDGASYWQRAVEWILPSAYAEEDEDEYQAVFEWDPVERADRYVIEISETADFRTPAVTQTVEKNEFVWKHVELKGYFWRVAAATKRGDMGYFSEPQFVDLKDVHSENVRVVATKKKRPE